jgi:hypothetical protein
MHNTTLLPPFAALYVQSYVATAVLFGAVLQ